MLESIRDWAVRQKFRFDLGTSFMVFVNFALLVVTASDNIKKVPFLENVHTIYFLVIGIVLTFFSVWLFGYILDRVVKYFHILRKEQSNRDPVLMDIVDRLKRIEGKLE